MMRRREFFQLSALAALVGSATATVYRYERTYIHKIASHKSLDEYLSERSSWEKRDNMSYINYYFSKFRLISCVSSYDPGEHQYIYKYRFLNKSIFNIWRLKARSSISISRLRALGHKDSLLEVAS